MNDDNHIMWSLYCESKQSGVIEYGFSDRGVTISRFTLIDDDIKMNIAPGGPDAELVTYFSDDYGTNTYPTVADAIKEFEKRLKEEDQYVKGAGKAFATHLTRNGTVVVVSIHQGNHWGEESDTSIYTLKGNWKDIPVDMEPGEPVAKFPSHTKDPDLSLVNYSTFDPPPPDPALKGMYIPNIVLPQLPGVKQLGKRIKEDVMRQVKSNYEDGKVPQGIAVVLKLNETIGDRLINGDPISSLDWEYVRRYMSPSLYPGPEEDIPIIRKAIKDQRGY